MIINTNTHIEGGGESLLIMVIVAEVAVVLITLASTEDEGNKDSFWEI